MLVGQARQPLADDVAHRVEQFAIIDLTRSPARRQCRMAFCQRVLQYRFRLQEGVVVVMNRKPGQRGPAPEVERYAEHNPGPADAEVARLAQRRDKERVAGIGHHIVELHSPDTAPEHHHLARIGRQHVVELPIAGAPDIERVEIGREIGWRRYELERM